jgi:geranylgeranyl diphosphate synthase type II
MSRFGERIGLAFQIVDDILDILSSNEILGKTVGSDEERDKATYPKVFGMEESKEIALNLSMEASQILDQIQDSDTAVLRELSNFVVKRVY